MADVAKAKASKAVRRAQADFERSHEHHEQVREARRKSFEEARAAGLSMREIGEAAGLHFTRVARILQAKPYTASGRRITERLIARLSANAEAGFDVDEIVRRRQREGREKRGVRSPRKPR